MRACAYVCVRACERLRLHLRLRLRLRLHTPHIIIDPLICTNLKVEGGRIKWEESILEVCLLLNCLSEMTVELTFKNFCIRRWRRGAYAGAAGKSADVSVLRQDFQTEVRLICMARLSACVCHDSLYM